MYAPREAIRYTGTHQEHHRPAEKLLVNTLGRWFAFKLAALYTKGTPLCTRIVTAWQGENLLPTGGNVPNGKAAFPTTVAKTADKKAAFPTTGGRLRWRKRRHRRG